MTYLRYIQISCISNGIKLEGKIALHPRYGGSSVLRRGKPAPLRDCFIKVAAETEAKPVPQRAGLVGEIAGVVTLSYAGAIATRIDVPTSCLGKTADHKMPGSLSWASVSRPCGVSWDPVS